MNRYLRMLINLLILLMCVGISFIQGCNSNQEEKIIEPDLSNQTSLYRRDLYAIRKTYLDNVESMRLKGREEEGYTVNRDSINPDLISGYFIYSAYAYRYSKKAKKTVALPYRAETQIEIVVDTILYSNDSLLCVSLVIIENHPLDDSEFNHDKKSKWFDGLAVIGYRLDKKEDFYLFPIEYWSTGNNTSYVGTRRELRNFYFNRIEGARSWYGTYTHGIGNPEFFNTAPDYKKDSQGRYSFETYYDRGEYHPYYKFSLKDTIE